MIARLRAAWTRALFAPESTASFALLRIAFGLVVVGWALSLTPDLLDFFGRDAIVPPGQVTRLRWSVLEWSASPPVVLGLWAGLLAAGVAFVVGWHARLANLVILVALLSFTRRNPWIQNSGDLLLRHIALLLLFAPTGAALSLDRRRRGGPRWPLAAPWPRRLLQIQLSVVYLFAARAKFPGGTWSEGTAVGYALRIRDLERFPVPDLLLQAGVLVNLITWGTLALEVCLAVLVWNRRLRPWVLLAGLGMHLAIDLTLQVGFFSYGVLALYLAFVEPRQAERFVDRVRERLRGRSPTPQPDGFRVEAERFPAR